MFVKSISKIKQKSFRFIAGNFKRGTPTHHSNALYTFIKIIAKF